MQPLQADVKFSTTSEFAEGSDGLAGTAKSTRNKSRSPTRSGLPAKSPVAIGAKPRSTLPPPLPIPGLGRCSLLARVCLAGCARAAYCIRQG